MEGVEPSLGGIPTALGIVAQRSGDHTEVLYPLSYIPSSANDLCGEGPTRTTDLQIHSLLLYLRATSPLCPGGNPMLTAL